jgi:hypothetical protein
MIVNFLNKNESLFKDLKLGQTFIVKDQLLIKTNNSKSEVNSLNLSETVVGNVICNSIFSETTVVIVDIEINVKEI